MSDIIKNARNLRLIIEKAVGGLSDSDALKAVTLYPSWRPKLYLEEGERVSFDGYLYKVKEGQSHTTQEGWEPNVATSLFEKVCESADGSIDNPIPYSSNMTLEEGKYYTQDEVLYKCFRNTEVAVYHDLVDLVGLYVERVEEV